MTINPLISTNSVLKPLPSVTNSQTPQTVNSALRTASNSTAGAPSVAASENQVQQAIEKIQQTTEKLAQNLQFSIDKDTGITVIKVLDSQTQEVIRQIPTEEAVSIARTLDKVQGLLFNDQA